MKRVGIYAGSFNPWHVGHANILQQSKNVFDEIIIAIGQNPMKPQKEKEPFPIGHEIFENVQIGHFTGLLSDYLNKIDYDHDDMNVFLIRGLRNGEDLQYEQNQIQFIKEMYPSLKVVFFICDKKFEHISSSSLRALKSMSPNEYEKYTFQPPRLPEEKKFGSNPWR